MAKKTPVKKSRRRLKRSIRRSLAAVLMITSIGVAAIPVPENYAAMEGNDIKKVKASDVHAEALKNFEYNVADAEAPDSSNQVATWAETNLNKYVKKDDTKDLDETKIWNDYGAEKGTRASMVIRQVDGVDTLSWQFLYYDVNLNDSGIGSGTREVICKYNGEYMAEKVELPLVLNTEYYTVEREIFNNYFAGKNPDGSEMIATSKWNTYVDKAPDTVYTYTFSDYKSQNFYDPDTEHFFKTYFAADVENKAKDFQRYLDSYDEDTGQYTEDINLTNQLERRPQDIQDSALQTKFYCEHDQVLKRQSKEKPYTLVSVQNQRPNDTKGGTVYVAKGGEPGQDYYNDNDGYLVCERSNNLICGIGGSAFKGNDRIQNLELPSMISFIGDHAFEGASLIKEINIANASFIGNQAFKECGSLSKIVIGEGTNTIGAECFYHTAVSDIKLPSTTQNIGYGAFAYCDKLTNIDLNSISQSCKIADFAFYECSSLKNVGMKNSQVISIGKGAFACTSGAELDFVFPSGMVSYLDEAKKKNSIGDFMFAGRSNLHSVVFPERYGRTQSTEVTLPANMFHECSNLAYVEFPSDNDQYACSYVSYDKDKMFADVANINFYVKGPKMKNLTEPAKPRETTWSAVMAIQGNPIPYLYIENGKEYYEVSNGIYLYCVDNAGMIVSCTLTPEARKNLTNILLNKDEIALEILPKVGNTKVIGIAPGCFSDKDLNDNVKSLVIPDDSLTEIGAEVFKGWKKLEKVTIGNSVATIGDGAFADCAMLEDVTFHSPSVGHEAFKVGKDAFKTGSSELTFHGDIVKGYAPFEWAMAPDNLINEDGLRVCYTSLAPTYLTVMYDANTGLVTLLDYPKFDQLEERLKEEYGIKGPYIEEMVEAMYKAYSGPNFDNVREAFKSLWIEAGDDKEAQEAAYKSEYYGPWITEDFCKGAGSWASTSGTGNITSGSSTESGEPDDISLMDFFFEPITAYAADASLMPYYTKYPYVIGDSGNADEQAFLNAVCNIEIPDGVESIDVYGFIRGVEGQTMNKNTANVNTYLMKKLDTKSWEMYTQRKPGASDPTNTDIVRGLFSGYYEDYESINPDREVYETANRGNDRVESITMHSVKYLPDYAFDSCERLSRVELGAALTDIGKAPFRGCYSMQAVGGNEKYECDNGIIYSKNTDGSYMIEECLSARGDKVGVPIVSASTDPKLNEVSTIRPGAFEDCDHLQEVNFGSRSTAGLTEIPEDCFRNCDRLDTVVLPMSVNDVASGAFVGANELGTLTFYGKEVKISGSAFDGEMKNRRTEVRTYKDSAVVRYVKEYGDAYLLYLPTSDDGWLGEQWKVTFLNFDYSVIEDLKDDEGNIIENPQYVEDGKVVERPQDAVLEGWTFEDWVGLNSTDIKKPIHEDTTFYAKGYSNDGTVGGKYAIDFYDSIDGKKIGPTQYIAPGGEAVAPAYPIHAGYTFDKWSDSFTNVKANKSILALYKATTVPGTSGGSTNTSNNTTNNPNSSNNSTSSSKNTSSDKNSSSSSSTSSTSSSNASTSTTSSDAAAGKHKVTVVNGAGSGDYTAGQTVWIIANPAADGQVFSKWSTSSQGVSLASVSSPTTSFTMPSSDVTVTAEYTAATAAPTTPTSTGGNGGGNGGGGTSTTGNGDTRVDITKPGISNKDLATANVNGSTDNFIVKITETDEATRAVADALTGKYGSLENILYYAMDISLYDSTGTVKITDTTGLSVDITVPIPDALVAYGGNNMAGAVVNGNQLESLNENFTTINGVPCIRFTATHFSPYTVYVDTGNLTEGMLDTTPKTGDPIHPKWFLSLGLACLSVILFIKKDKKVKVKTA